MQTFLIILIVLAAIGALVSLVRGIVAFLRTSQADLTGTGPNISGMRQNKMMWRRVQFQALAVVLVVLFLMLTRPG
ncbi:HIG1 domain-containing protein [Sphingomonas montana]|uniref:HIG1 domain-containing protein n=1 Tax=Sphingomonas montana TaxID=1843236 RepID=UPI00096DEBEE|nr:HIG1 domain-containing protein [Sphingomonas montana]